LYIKFDKVSLQRHHFRLRMHQKEFGDQAPPGPTRELTMLPQTSQLDLGEGAAREGIKGSRGKGGEEREGM